MNSHWFEYFRIPTPSLDHLNPSINPTSEFTKPSHGSAAYWDGQPGYRTYPELSRAGPGAYYVLATAVAGTVLFGGTVVVTNQFQKIVDRAPEAEQPGLWQMLAAGLTGGFSPGSIKI
jgi:hypothetical protein